MSDDNPRQAKAIEHSRRNASTSDPDVELIRKSSERNDDPGLKAKLDEQAKGLKRKLGKDLIGIAKRFAKTLGDIIRWRGDWYRWNGQQWEQVEDQIIQSRFYKWIIEAKVPVEPTRRVVGDVLAALAGIHQLGDQRREPPFWLSQEIGDPPASSLLPFQNGVLDLGRPFDTELRPPDIRLFTQTRIACDYDPNAKAPRWDQFMREVFPDDVQSVEALEEMLGYFLTDDTSMQKAFAWIGVKRSGKSTIARLVQKALGPGRTANPTLSQFSQNFGRQGLIGRTVALITDSRGMDRFNPHGAVESILSIVGEDSQTVQRKNKEDWNGRLSTRVVLMSNSAPSLKDATGVIVSRFIAIYFSQSFFGREDPTLFDKLAAELPGIVNKWIAGLWRLKNRGYFIQPETGKHLLENMEEQASPIQNFVRECCVIGPEHETVKQDLYNAAKDWLRDNGHHPISAETFSKDLYGLGLGIIDARVQRGYARNRMYKGVGFAPSPLDGGDRTASTRVRQLPPVIPPQPPVPGE